MTANLRTIAGAGGSSCFARGSQVQLEGGLTVAIEDLRVGDIVLGFNDKGQIARQTVTKLHHHPEPCPLLLVRFWGGSVRITPNHWVLNQYGNFAEIGRMAIDDALVDGLGHLRPILEATKIEPAETFNLTVTPDHTFICDGVRVHNGGHREVFPVVAGAGGGGSSKSSGGSAPTEESNTIASQAFIAIQDLLCEGQIGGLALGAQSIYLNNTPLQNPDGSYNFNGVTWDQRTGYQNQPVMAGFNDIETPYEVGVQVKVSVPYTFSVANPNADHVRVIVDIPALETTDTNTGDIHGTTVEYYFQESINGGAWGLITAGYNWAYGGTASYPYYSDLGTTALTFTPSAPNNAVSGTVILTGANNGTITFQPEFQATAGGPWYAFGSEYSMEYVRSGEYQIVNGSGSGDSYNVITTTQVTQPVGIVSPQQCVAVRLVIVSETPGAGLAISSYGNVQTGNPTNYVTINGKTNSKYQRSHLLTITSPGTPTSFRMVRVTPDSTFTYLENDTYVDSYTEIVSQQLNYPNSALVAIRLNSAQFDSIPTRSYDVQGLYIQVPSNYNPVTNTYTGVWNGTFTGMVSNNPAWVLYDMLTNKRYGLGNYINPAQVNVGTLYQIGQYCDELVPNGFGGYEKRFTINTAIQTQQDGYKLISDLCSVFRGMAFWTGGQVNFMQDAPGSASMLYTNANVVDGIFTYVGGARKDRHSCINVTWNDPKNYFKRTVEYVEDPELIQQLGIRRLETVAFGCSSRGQAYRTGKWILYTEKYESAYVQFKVGLDSALVIPGELIEIHDQYRAGKRFGGRLISCTTAGATLDSAVTINGTGQINIMLPNGQFQTVTVNEANQTTNTVTFATALTAVPVANAIWIMQEADLAPMLCRVVGVTQDSPDNKHEWTITAIQSNQSKYAAIEDGYPLQFQNISILSPSFVSGVSEFTITETQYLAAPATIGNKLHLSWFSHSTSFTLKYRQIAPVYSNWKTVQISDSPAYEIDNVAIGTYEFQLWSTNPIGVQSTMLDQTFVVTPKTTPPQDVPDLFVNPVINGLTLTWGVVTDFDLQGYEIRRGASWDTGTVLVQNFQGNSFTDHVTTVGTFNYMVRAINLEQIYSADVTSCAYTVVPPGSVSGFTCVTNGGVITFRWQPNPENNIESYELREGTSWANANFITQVAATTYAIPASSATGTRTFWIKAIATPGVYSTDATYTSTVQAQPTDRNIIYTDDQYATGFPGIFYGCDLLDGYMELIPGSLYAEYIWTVPLPYQADARNTLQGFYTAIIDDPTTWAEATWSWDSPSAGRAWISAGDITTVNMDHQMSLQVGLTSSQIDGFTLNGTTTSLAGTAASTATGVAYATGRFAQGLQITDETTKVGWTKTVAPEFNSTMWIKPVTITNGQIFWRVTSGSVSLEVGYSVANGWFYLTDGTNQITVPYALTAGVEYFIGINQDSTGRGLYVSALGQTGISSAWNYQNYAPINGAANISSISLYPASGTAGSPADKLILSSLVFGNTVMNTQAQWDALSPLSSQAGYSNFTPYIVGDYNYLNAIIKTILTSTSDSTPQVNVLEMLVDLPDITDGGSNVATSASGPVTVNFNRPFNIAPVVTAVQQGGTGLAIPQIVGTPTKTSFQIQTVNASNALVAAEISWAAKGY
jgi:predicted phage tail protein